IQFNSSYGWTIGPSYTNYDVYTVAVHEVGHALGLLHSSSDTGNVLYPYYNAIKYGLSSDDIAGVRAVYSGGAPRTPDYYGLYAPNHVWQVAANIQSSIS